MLGHRDEVAPAGRHPHRRLYPRRPSADLEPLERSTGVARDALDAVAVHALAVGGLGGARAESDPGRRRDLRALHAPTLLQKNRRARLPNAAFRRVARACQLSNTFAIASLSSFG